MTTGSTDERHGPVIIGGLVATVVTLVLWFAGLAFLRWTLEQGVDAGLGPSFIYYVVFPVALAGLAWLAGSAAWRLARGDLDDELASPRQRDAARRAGLVAPFVALVVNQVVWNASLDRFDWLNSFGFDPFNLATLVVLIVSPLLLAGVTIWAGLAVRALMIAPDRGDESLAEPAWDPADD